MVGSWDLVCTIVLGIVLTKRLESDRFVKMRLSRVAWTCATIDGERIPLSFQLSMNGEPAVEALIAAIKDKSELRLQVRAHYKDDKINSGIVIKVNDCEPLSLLPSLPDD